MKGKFVFRAALLREDIINLWTHTFLTVPSVRPRDAGSQTSRCNKQNKHSILTWKWCGIFFLLESHGQVLFFKFYVFNFVAFQVNPIVEKKTSLVQRAPKKILTVHYLIWYDFFTWKMAFNSEEIESSNGFFSLWQSSTSSKPTNLWRTSTNKL